MSEISPNQPPKLFISYSWSSPEHEAWVYKLAEDLVGSGVDVILDKWSLLHGNDTHAFMEQANHPSVNKVAMICDQKYVEKANLRDGGVGVEAQIITPGVYKSHSQTKYVAIVVERDDDNRPCIPNYYGSKKYIDYSDVTREAQAFEELQRWIFDQPLYVRPLLGQRPAFLNENPSSTRLSTGPLQRRAIESLRNGRPNGVPALQEYFDTFVAELEKFRIKLNHTDTDEVFMQSIEEFIPYRNEMVDIFSTISAYADNSETRHIVHTLFEGMMYYFDRPEDMTQCRDLDFDNYKFITQELFIYCIAVFLKNQRFETVCYLLENQYYAKNRNLHSRDMVSYTTFRQYIKSFEWRNERKKLNRISLQADIMKERCKGVSVDFYQLMAADFTLYLRSAIHPDEFRSWYPTTCMYLDHMGHAYRPLELFSRAKSKSYFEKLKIVFSVQNVSIFREKVVRISTNSQQIPRWQFETLDVGRLTNISEISTLS